MSGVVSRGVLVKEERRRLCWRVWHERAMMGVVTGPFLDMREVYRGSKLCFLDRNNAMQCNNFQEEQLQTNLIEKKQGRKLKSAVRK